MSTRARRTQEEEFLTAAWEAIRTTEHDYDVSVDLELVPQKQKGVWLVYLVATDMRPGLGFNRVIARYRREFPSAQNGTLAGGLFAAALQLDGLVSLSGGREGQATHKQDG